MDYVPENHSHSTCVKLLIESGADVNGKAVGGVTALINAASNDDHRCLDLLIQAGADVNQPDDNGKTPLTSADFFGSAESLQKLLSAGAEVNALHYKSMNALIASMHNAQICWDQDEEHCHSLRNCKQKEIVKMLIEAGADVNVQTYSGMSALIKASANGHKECVD